MTCRICGGRVESQFSLYVLGKYSVNYEYCKNCDFLQTETPYWLHEAYSDALNIFDTGVMQRNLSSRDIVAPLIYYFINRNGRYLDYAGGYGIFTRLMRDVGFNFLWSDKYAQNLLARGFEHKNTDRYNAITCFEYFEHSENPVSDIKKMLELAPIIIFSTLLRPCKIPEEDWWYYGQEHGQHISFFSLKTLEYLATSINLSFISNGTNFHVFIPNNLVTQELKDYVCHGTINRKIKNIAFKEIGNNYWKSWIKSFIGLKKYQIDSYPNMGSLTFKDHLFLKSKYLNT